MELMRRRRGIMGLNGGGIPIIAATATGNPLSFITDMVRPLKSLEIPFTPIQSGSGNPSPTNVRPISGWTGCEINISGKNIIDYSQITITLNKLIAANGSLNDNEYFDTCSLIPIKPGTVTLSGSCHNSTGSTVVIGLYDHEQVFSERLLGAAHSVGSFSETFEIPEGIAYIRISLISAKNANAPFSVLQCEYGNAATTYENGHLATIPITFTDPSTGDPVTVYGGTVTLNEDGSADLVVDKAAADLSTLTWSQLTKTRYVTEDLATTMPAARNNDSKIGCISEKYTEYTQNRLYGGKSDPATIGMSVSNMHQLCIRTAQSYSDWGDTPSGKFVYPLMNPVSYHFDDVGQLITFLGTNTIWTDTNGTNTATYFKHQS